MLKPHHPMTVMPLEGKERDVFLKGLSEFRYEPEDWYVDPIKTVLFLYHTGCHSDVLAHPEKRKLHVNGDGYIVWWRAKKTIQSPSAFIVVPPYKDIQPWYREYIDTLPNPKCHPKATPYKVGDGVDYYPHCNCQLRFHRVVRRFGKAVGLPHLSPRTLRHSLARRLYQHTGDITTVIEMLGVCQTVALRYAKLGRAANLEASFSEGVI